jgi:astacin
VSDFVKISNADTNDLGVPYDLASLMHYGPKAFSKSASLNTIESLDGSTNFGQRNGLSDKDIEQARLLYCPGTSGKY